MFATPTDKKKQNHPILLFDPWGSVLSLMVKTGHPPIVGSLVLLMFFFNREDNGQNNRST